METKKPAKVYKCNTGFFLTIYERRKGTAANELCNSVVQQLLNNM